MHRPTAASTVYSQELLLRPGQESDLHRDVTTNPLAGARLVYTRPAATPIARPILLRRRRNRVSARMACPSMRLPQTRHPTTATRRGERLGVRCVILSNTSKRSCQKHPSELVLGDRLFLELVLGARSEKRATCASFSSFDIQRSRELFS
jgi:hypothetical protein